MTGAVACSTELFVVDADSGGDIDSDPVRVGVHELGLVLTQVEPGALELLGEQQRTAGTERVVVGRLSARRLERELEGHLNVLSYTDSLGHPAGLVGWSAGADLALLVAARSDAVDAAAVYEPALPSLLDEPTRMAYLETFARMGELASEGRLTAAMRTFAAMPFGDDELAVAEDAGYLEAAGRYVPNLLSTIQQQPDQQQPEYRGPTPDDPAALGAISSPVLVLTGSDTKPLMARSVQHVADHVPNATVREISGAGHAANLTHPEALAEALIGFFSVAQQPA